MTGRGAVRSHWRARGQASVGTRHEIRTTGDTAGRGGYWELRSPLSQGQPHVNSSPPLLPGKAGSLRAELQVSI